MIAEVSLANDQTLVIERLTRGDADDLVGINASAEVITWNAEGEAIKATTEVIDPLNQLLDHYDADPEASDADIIGEVAAILIRAKVRPD